MAKKPIFDNQNINLPEGKQYKINDEAIEASVDDLNLLDGAVAGTAVASKALVLDANKGVDTLGVGTLLATVNVGAAAADVTAVEYGNSTNHKTVLTVTAFTQAIAGAALGFGKSIYTFPEGVIKAIYGTVDITIFGATETGTPDIGLGTEIASGVIDVLDGTATFENIVDGFTGTAITTTPGSVTNNYVEAEAGLLDGNTTAIEAFLNLAETWTATEDLTISATVTLFWDFLGDY